MNERDRETAVWWLRLARGELRSAVVISAAQDVPSRIVAAQLQQATEKALKAAIAREGLDPPRLHDLAALARLVSSSLPGLPRLDELAQARDAVESARYPEPGEPDYDPTTLGVIRDVAERTVAAVAALLAADGVAVDRADPA